MAIKIYVVETGIGITAEEAQAFTDLLFDTPIHKCTGTDDCELPARCSHCPTVASEATPVYVLRIEDEDYFLCEAGIANEGWRVEEE